MSGEIYIIKNYINEKVYIGQTTQGSDIRFKQHLKLLKSNSKQLIHKAIKKYGKENFYYEILENNIDIKMLDEKEEYWINYYDSYNYGYNLCKGGSQSRKLPNPIFEEKHDEILYRYVNENISIRMLANDYNVNYKSLSTFLKNNNIIIQNRNKSFINLTEQEKIFIANMYQNNKTSQEIANAMHRDVHTVRRYRNYKCCT